MTNTDIYRLTAVEAVALLRKGELSPMDLLDASIARIEAVNSKVNALPILCFERARDQARKLAAQSNQSMPAGWLYGLPIAVKDYNDLAGVRTTFGSPIYVDNIPAVSDATVARLERYGALPVGKSNVPEFAGANTFNSIFGATLNPWDRRLSAGGSSGGSAVSLATGMVWLATGNDLGGSLRTPASFNGVVGLRPSPGRVPRGARLPAFDTLWVEGPMARCVADVALMLDATAGHEPDDPLSFDSSPGLFSQALENTGLPKRVAFSPDLGVVPVEPEVADICLSAAKRFTEIGCVVTDDIPDFGGVIDAFQTLRAVLFGSLMGPTLEEHREQIAPEIIWNIEKAFSMTPEELLEAERLRWTLFHRMASFFETHDLLLCPAVSVPPFPVEQRYVETIAGRPCETYIDWIAITFVITMTSCPAISLPCGFTKSGLPVGLQIVGPPRGEAALLRAAHRMEDVFQAFGHVPIDPR